MENSQEFVTTDGISNKSIILIRKKLNFGLARNNDGDNVDNEDAMFART